VKVLVSRIYRLEYIWLSLIVLAVLAAHLSVISLPKELILDEQHYVKDARYILANHQTERPEHPPLAKLMIMGGILALGDNPWGWRVPAIVMSVIGIVLFYFICRRLKMSPIAVNIATFLYGFENFTFMQGSVAMLDVFMLTMILAVFLLYLYRQYILSGVFLGLAALTKVIAVLAAPVIFIHWLLNQGRRSVWFALTAFFAPVSFVVLMPLFDYAITGHFQNPASRIDQILSLAGSLKFSNTQHEALSRPWEWLLNYQPMPYWYTPHYTAAISPTIWILIIPIVLYMIFRAVKGSEAGLFGSAWFFGLYVLWIPFSIFTDRISFIFYVYPAIGALCLGLGMGIGEILEKVKSKTRKIKIPTYASVSAFLILHLAVFAVLSPVFFRH
jgi:dolichyl-phosphate-mannose-protein mannosyltransferase